MTNISEELEPAYDSANRINDDELRETVKECIDYSAVFGLTVEEIENPEDISESWGYGVAGFNALAEKAKDYAEDKREIVEVVDEFDSAPNDRTMNKIKDLRNVNDALEAVASSYLEAFKHTDDETRESLDADQDGYVGSSLELANKVLE